MGRASSLFSAKTDFRRTPFDQGEPIRLVRQETVGVPAGASSDYCGQSVRVCLFRVLDILDDAHVYWKDLEDLFTDSRFADFSRPQFVFDVPVRRALLPVRRALFEGLSGVYYFQQAFPTNGERQTVWYRGERAAADGDFDLQRAHPLSFREGEMILLFYV